MAVGAVSDGRIRISRVIHTIHATADLAACRARYMNVLGGLIFAESYFEPEDRDMALLYVANAMIEPMAPRNPGRMEVPLARYLHRYGEGLHSFEVMVDDAPAAAAKLKAAGCKLAADHGYVFFVRQESAGGVLLEVCEVSMPNDPYDRRGWRPDWSEGHPTTLLRLDHIACVTPDLPAVLSLFTGQLDGELLSDEPITSPQAGRRALVRLGDAKVAFIQPDEVAQGPLGARLKPPTSGVYAMVWQVEDEAAAEAFVQGKGLQTTREGCVSTGFAIRPGDFFGARHEFVASAS